MLDLWIELVEGEDPLGHRLQLGGVVVLSDQYKLAELGAQKRRLVMGHVLTQHRHGRPVRKQSCGVERTLSDSHYGVLPRTPTHLVPSHSRVEAHDRLVALTAERRLVLGRVKHVLGVTRHRLPLALLAALGHRNQLVAVRVKDVAVGGVCQLDVTRLPDLPHPHGVTKEDDPVLWGVTEAAGEAFIEPTLVRTLRRLFCAEGGRELLLQILDPVLTLCQIDSRWVVRWQTRQGHRIAWNVRDEIALFVLHQRVARIGDCDRPVVVLAKTALVDRRHFEQIGNPVGGRRLHAARDVVLVPGAALIGVLTQPQVLVGVDRQMLLDQLDRPVALQTDRTGAVDVPAARLVAYPYRAVDSLDSLSEHQDLGRRVGTRRRLSRESKHRVLNRRYC